jgi:DNA-binding transcriptional MocR family regulator
MSNYTIISNDLITSNVSDGAYRLYNYLLSMCYGEKTECYPSQEYLSKALRKSVRTIQRYIDELINAKLIAKKRRVSISNVYTLITKKVTQKADMMAKKVKETWSKAFNKNAKRQSNFDSYEQRNYNFNKLEDMLLGNKPYSPSELYKKE